MFKVNYRMIDEIDELKSMDFNFFDTDYGHISGFIEIQFGQQKEGCYNHENPLQEGEVGGEWVDYWLDGLLDVANSLSITKYAAPFGINSISRLRSYFSCPPDFWLAYYFKNSDLYYKSRLSFGFTLQ